MTNRFKQGLKTFRIFFHTNTNHKFMNLPVSKKQNCRIKLASRIKLPFGGGVLLRNLGKYFILYFLHISVPHTFYFCFFVVVCVISKWIIDKSFRWEIFWGKPRRSYNSNSNGHTINDWKKIKWKCNCKFGWKCISGGECWWNYWKYFRWWCRTGGYGICFFSFQLFL